jgi:hypothetical protein
MEPHFYAGEAVLHADGVQFWCRANLRCWADSAWGDRTLGGPTVYDGPTKWIGRLRFDSGADAEAVLFARSLRLVVDGAESDFLADSIDRTTAALMICGSGAPPF